MTILFTLEFSKSMCFLLQRIFPGKKSFLIKLIFKLDFASKFFSHELCPIITSYNFRDFILFRKHLKIFIQDTLSLKKSYKVRC